MTDHILDKAASASPRALFAALQMALLQMVDLSHQYADMDAYDAAVARVEAALELGAPLGSPEHLAHLEHVAFLERQ